MSLIDTSKEVPRPSINAVLEHHIREAYVAILKLHAVSCEETERPHAPVSITMLNRARELAPLAIAFEQVLHHFE